MQIKGRWKPPLGLLLVIVLGAAGCDSGNGTVDETTTTTTTVETTTSTEAETTTTTAPGPTGSLLVWADDIRAPVVEAAAAAFTAETGVEVTVEPMGIGDIKNNVEVAAPAGEGPDVFIGVHDWTGDLALAGVISPIGLQSRVDEFVQVAIDALTYQGDIYGVPFSTEAVSLFYNKALVSQPPADFEALRTVCDGLGYPTEDGLPCLAIPVGEPLHQFPFIAGFGGYVFGFENGAFDPTDVGIDTPGAIEGAEFLSSVYLDGYAGGTVDYSVMADLFNQGTVPFMWTGPWQVDAVDAAGIDYGVAKLPLMEGVAPRPFVGVQGFFLNSFSENTVTAETFLLDYLTTADTIVQLSGATKRPPALRSALDQASADANLAAFAESSSGGLPLPNIPEMEKARGPLANAFLLIGQGADDPAALMTEAAEAVRVAIAAG